VMLVVSQEFSVRRVYSSTLLGPVEETEEVE
jgi:hypothetical protein